MAIDNSRFEKNWLTANKRIQDHPNAAHAIANSYGRDRRTGRRTAVCAASMNTPLWQHAVTGAYPKYPQLI